ncbi:MAG: hypothetical protein Q8R29_01045 [bacterium]|nr:hypothetical protein [bacterium]
MADKVINLKKTTAVKDDFEVSKPEETRETNDVFLRWSSYEREKLSHRPLWFLWPTVAVLVFVIFGLFAKSYFFIALVVLAFVVFAMYATREPEKFEFAVTPQGILINHKLHVFSELKSFCIFDKPAMKELSLETIKVLYPFIHIPTEGVKIAELKEVLGHFLPEKEHPIFLIDQLVKRWGL